MGLAATQARFLAITSRKANCEYRSLELARQKLSLTRDLDDATAEYQNALNATRLVWDPTSTGEFRYDLSYDILMNPSDYNSYIPYFLSRQDGKLAMDSNMMKAIRSVFNYDEATGTCDGGLVFNGLVYYEGDPDYEIVQALMFDQFIDSLRANKAMPSTMIEKMKNTNGDYKYIYYPNAGRGAPLSSRETYNMMTANSMTSYIDYIVENAMSGYFPVDSAEWKLAENLIFDFEMKKSVLSAEEKLAKNYKESIGASRYNMNNTMSHSYKTNNGYTYLYKNGSIANNINYSDTDNNKTGGMGVAQYSSSAFTLADLLQDDIALVVNNKQSYNTMLELLEEMAMNNMGSIDDIINLDVDQWYNKVKKDDKAFANLVAAAQSPDHTSNGKSNGPRDHEDAQSNLAILNFIDKLAKSMNALLMPDPASTTDKSAFTTALVNTISRLRNYDGNYVDLGGQKRSESNAVDAANQSHKYNCWVKKGEEWAISLSNLTEAFLTDFVNGMDFYQDGCLITKNVSSSSYITDYPDYLFTINVTDDKDTGIWESEYYSILFNTLCTSGCYENDMVKDKVYLDNAIKNAQLFVVSKSETDYYYQSRYTDVSGGHLVAETDTAAIAAAEVEYSYKKSQINYKEEKIEIESKQLDAEISELTTEMESVRAMMTKNIEKSFKFFQS